MLTLPSSVEVVPFEIVRVEEVIAVRVLVSLVLTGIPVALVAEKFVVTLPTGSDIFVVVYETDVVSCGTVVSVVVLVEFPDGGGTDDNVVNEVGPGPSMAVEELAVTRGTVGDEGEFDSQGPVSEAVAPAEPLVENEFIKVILVENAEVLLSSLVVVDVLSLDIDGLVMTSSVEVNVVVLISSVVTTETENTARSLLGITDLCRSGLRVLANSKPLSPFSGP